MAGFNVNGTATDIARFVERYAPKAESAATVTPYPAGQAPRNVAARAIGVGGPVLPSWLLLAGLGVVAWKVLE